MSDIPIEEINETIPEGDGSGFLLLVGIVGLIVLLWYQGKENYEIFEII
jgi:hypothetical protein